MTGIMQMFVGGVFGGGPGSQSYTTPGTYTWVAPAGVTSVSVLAVGGGAGGTTGTYTSGRRPRGGYGGSLAYKNNITVTPGSSYTVVVGAGGAGGNSPGCGGRSWFNTCTTVRACGGISGCFTRSGNAYIGDGGGSGGGYGDSCFCSSGGGGGGAGGFNLGGNYCSGNGGAGSNTGGAGRAGTNGGGGGGSGGGICISNACSCGLNTNTYFWPAGAGGGVGLLGRGTNGAGGAAGPTVAGQAGSPGSGGSGTTYGGGGGGGGQASPAFSPAFAWAGGNGGGGAVRIVWPGATRQFPTTCVGNP